MDVNKRLETIRAEVKGCAESLLRAAEECDTPEELAHFNAIVQAGLQRLQSSAYLIGLAIKERDGS